MHSATWFHLSTLFCAGLAAALVPREPEAAQACGETTKLFCFGVDGGDDQKVDVDDIAYAAAYLRYLASKADKMPLWTMPPEFDCGEWTLPRPEDAGTVLVLAKHVSPRTNSSVTYEDIARTLDGGEDATDADKAKALIGACGTHGGWLGVTVNATDPAYHTPEYTSSKAKPEGIIIKLVHSQSS